MLKAFFACIIVVILPFGECRAHLYAWTFEGQTRESDVIVVGRVVDTGWKIDFSREATIEVETVVKGGELPKKHLVVEYGNSLFGAKEDPVKFEVGQVHIFFLVKLKVGRYTIIGKRPGYYAVDGAGKVSCNDVLMPLEDCIQLINDISNEKFNQRPPTDTTH